MIDVNELTIGQARELAALLNLGNSVGPAVGPAVGQIDHGLQIAVLDRGFVYIGRVVTDDKWCHISGAWNIRRWGTTHGLGELVDGPTPHTELDRVGDVRVPLHSLQHLIAVKGEKWTSKLD